MSEETKWADDTYAYLKGIEDFKEALKKALNNPKSNIKPSEIYKVINLIDTVKPLNHDNRGDKQENGN